MRDDLIGMGVYTLQEAALYSQISAHKLSRWMFGTSVHQPVVKSELYQQRLLSFLDLIQAMAIDRARDAGVTLPKIREAIRVAEEKHGLTFPLAREHKLWLWDGDLHIRFPDQSLEQLTGRQRGQRGMTPIVEPFMQDLHFDTEGLAKLFTPYKKYGKQIVLDPKVQFGQPVVAGTGYRADVLANACETEKSKKLVAEAFGVTINDVRVAVAYITSLLKEAA